VVPAVLDRNIFKPLQGRPLVLSFRAPEAGKVKASIFNMAGEHVRQIFDNDVQAEAWVQAQWEGRNKDGEVVASGVYIVSVRGAGIRTVKKVVVIK